MDRKINVELTVEEIGILEYLLYKELDVIKDEIESFNGINELIKLGTKQAEDIRNILAQLKR